MRILLLFFLFTIQSFGQVFLIGKAPIVVSEENFASSYTQGTTETDSLLIWVTRGKAQIDSLVLSSNLTMTADSQMIADSSRTFSDTTTYGDWLAYNSMVIDAENDSTLSLDNTAGNKDSARAELSQPTVSNQGYQLSFDVGEGEDNLFDDGKGVFNSGTESWLAYGTNTLTNVNGELEITYVDDPDGALIYFNDNKDLSTDLVVGEYYTVLADVYTNTGSARVRVYNGSSYEPFTTIGTTPQTFECTYQAATANTSFFRVSSIYAGQKAYVDNVKIYKLDDSTQSVERATLLTQYGYYEDGSFVVVDSVRSDTLSQTLATVTKDFIGYTHDSSYFRISLSDTGKAIIDNFGLSKKYDSFIVTYPDTTVVNLTADVSTVGNFSESAIIYGTFPTSPDTQSAVYSVLASDPETITTPYNLVASSNGTTGNNIIWSDSNAVDTLISIYNDFVPSTELSEWTAWQGATNEISVEAAQLRVFDNSSPYSWLAATRTIDVNSSTTYRISIDGYIGDGNSWWFVVRGSSGSPEYIDKSWTADGDTTIIISNPTADSLQIWLQGNLDNGESVYFDNFLVEYTSPKPDSVELYAQPFYNGTANGNFSLLTTQVATDTTYTHVLSDGDQYAYKARFINDGAYSSYSNLDTATYSETANISEYTPDIFLSSSYGDDTNTGLDSANAWATISKLNDTTLSAGTVVAFHRGDQFSGTTLLIDDDGSSGSEIVYTTYGSGSKPIIGNPASSLTRALNIRADYITIDNLKIYGTDNTSDSNGVTIGTVADRAQNITFNECVFEGGDEGHNNSVAIWAYADSVVIDSCEFTEWERALRLYHPYNYQISYNYFYNNYSNPGTDADALIDIAKGTTGFDCNYTFHVYNNEFTKWDGYIIRLSLSVDEVLFEYNYVHTPYTNAEKSEQTNSPDYDGNTIGKLSDAESGSATGHHIFRYNIFKDIEVGYDDASTRTEGVLHSNGYGLWVYGNIFYNIWGAVFDRGVTGGTTYPPDGTTYPYVFAYNTCIDVANDDYYDQYAIYNNTWDVFTPTKIHNNIFDVGNSGSKGALIKSEQFEYGDNAWTNRSSVDQDHDGSVNSDIAYWILGDGSNTITLSGDTDLWNVGIANILDTSDLLYVSTVGRSGVYVPDVTPLSSTGVVDEAQLIGNDPAGYNVDAYDILGNVRNTPDIGAVEYGASLQTAPVLISQSDTEVDSTTYTVSINYFNGNLTTTAQVYFNLAKNEDSVYTLTPNVDSTTASKTFSSLTLDTTYYYKPFVTNSLGSDIGTWDSIVTVSGISPDCPGNDLAGNYFDAGKGCFETDTESWSADGSNTITDTTASNNGSGALRIKYVDNNSGARLYLRDNTDLSSNLTAGNDYRLELYAKRTGTGNVNVRVCDADGDDLVITAALTGTYTKYTLDFTAPAGKDPLYIFVRLANFGSDDGMVLIDDVTLIDN